MQANYYLFNRRTIQSEIFSMDNYIARSRIEQALKSLELTSVVSTASDNWRSVWESVQHLYQKIRIFYQQFYRMMSLNDGK